MPFKLKLKKTRQYNVASKSLFVISVELLDGGVADCTLSVDSSGQECLDNVCQRQAINQPEFFGLRYIDRSQQPRWVQLERPLKRQLDKYASSHQLYLRVMYYVISGTSLITDEVTRYHYFLQLKNDLVEGRIICDCQQAVVLASYSRQAEYGNHDRERHTVEYLKNLLTFPKQILDGGQIIDSSTLAETGKLEYLTAAVIQHHMALHNMSQAQAEEGFITACQQLRGYGQEMFAARNQRDQTDATIAISLTGIRVLTEASDAPTFYRWMDITNVINHKRTFSIECCKAESASFALPSPEDGKYVWRACIRQHTFYMRHQRALSEQPYDEPRPNFQEHGLSESREELEVRPPPELGSARLQPLTAAHRAHSTSCLELAEPHPPLAHRNRALLPSYRPAPDYETAVQQKHQQQRLAAPGPPRGYGSHPDMQRLPYDRRARPDDYYALDYRAPYPLVPYVNVYEQSDAAVYKPPPPYPASSSTPDLASLAPPRPLLAVTGSSPDLVSARYLVLGLRAPPSHGTYGDLPSVLVGPRAYDDRYRAPYRRPAPPSDHEPIYENVPLPWQSERNIAMRDRAQSLTTTDEIARLNERNGSHPAINNYGNLNTTLNVPRYHVPMKIETPDSHYVNAQIIKGVRESSVPKEASNRSINRDEFENVTLAVDRISLRQDEKECDETPYQSLSPHRVSNNNTINKSDNVTSIKISDQSAYDRGGDMAPELSSSTNSEANETKTSLSSKEKKRRRWGVFMGRGAKPELRSATLGRDRAKPAPQPPNKHRWSTGLPKFQPLPPSITKETLCQLLERKMSDEQVAFAFERLPKGRERGGSVQTALLAEHAALNGGADSLPYDDNRVRLRPTPANPHGYINASHVTVGGGAPQTALNGGADSLPYDDNRVRLRPTPANPHGYINASHVTMTVGSTQRFYVVIKVGVGAPAGPGGCGCGCAGVWDCAWTVGARLLALVGGAACPHYLPAGRAALELGGCVVSCVSVSRARWGASTRVRVSRGGRARLLWHVHYTNWPDGQAVPDAADFLSFLLEVNGLRLACSAEAAAEGQQDTAPPGRRGGAWPLVVCCSRGRGRSGTALAADALLHIVDNNQELDIPRTISMLHQQRANLVDSAPQYQLLLRLLLHYLRQSRLI
ncbi:tyrosine-protein phosphatase non-receptor type 21 [Ostrinia nubilalis]|uniref:tyrosine-protein phosphatase non-receptor type 21 n=1 Tax=Ostrinia nubilalis TaxID=29057 RepID=UPI0030824DFF